jgi:hypothetical protein
MIEKMFNVGPPISAKDIADFEHQQGVVLPGDYRAATGGDACSPLDAATTAVTVQYPGWTPRPWVTMPPD